MRIGLLTDSLGHMAMEPMLDAAAELGVRDLEFATGGWSEAPHLDLKALLAEAAERDRFLGMLRERGMRVVALNANGNQLHPVIGPEVDAVLRGTVELASLLDVPTVVCMSGLPGGAPGDRTPNWITTSWPPETQTILDYQWNEVALPYWRDMARHGSQHGVRFAVEMHGKQLVYNAATLLRLREAVGPAVGANLDPSHPMWMGVDPRSMARALDGVIHHVHVKDVRIHPEISRVHGVLDTLPPERARDRAWNYVTLGLGHPGGQQFWGQLLSDLRNAGYDGVLSIEHEDVTQDALEGVRQSVALLRSVLLEGPPSWKPAEV
ncbi:MAG: sugar phosphate isomerase/epimerase [Propionibacteriaceae bacterium]|nr:sugar phosphate isomerase/epimerase [Propionibacteriaceae bacterium]